MPVPIRLLHGNELDGGLATVAVQVRTPVVLARAGDNWVVVAGDEELNALAGSVEGLEQLLHERLALADQA